MANVVAKFSLSEENNIDAIFKIDAAGTTWGSIDGTLSNQTDLQAALDLKADKSTVEADFEALSDTVAGNYTALDNKIDSVQSDLSGNISALSNTVTSNNTAVNNRIDTTNSNLSALQTTVNNNNTAINNRVNTLETSLDADIEELNTHLSDLVDTVGNNYTDLSGQISETNINLATLNTTVSSNYTALDNKIDGVDSELSGDIGELETELTELTTTVANNNTAINQKVDTLETTLTGDINTLSGTVSSNYTTLDTKIDNTKTEIEGDISALSGTVTSNYNDLNSAITTSASTINARIDSEVDDLNAAVTAEATTRENADNALQSQIDAITAASDVVDIVGTYAQLQTYDTASLQTNDIIKVLKDETHNNASAYYRWTGSVWSYIGSEGPYATPEYVGNNFVPQSRTINNKALSENITLTASDVNALPNTTVIGDGVLTLQKNGANIDTFSANSTANKSINIEVPTALSELTNDTGFITDADLSDLETSVENNTANITALSGRVSTVETTLNTKANTSDIPTKTSDLTNDSGFITNAALTNYALKSDIPEDVSELNNDAGYITDAALTGYATENWVINQNYVNSSDLNTTLTNYQPLLISGTNIKTINNTSLLGNGDITINPSPDIDNSTITKNTNDELQAVGVIDQNTEETLKAWKGTAAQFNAIEAKSNNTLYYIVDAGQIYCGNKLISNNYSQNVGAVVTSLLPLTDAGLHLCDGTLLLSGGIYDEFVQFIKELYEEDSAGNYFTTESDWQASVSNYGECGKFVYDSTNNTVRLPKLSGIMQVTTDKSKLGNLVQAGLPNITGSAQSRILNFDASKSNSIYGNSSTVQPQTVQVFVYIVVATTTKTDIQVDIDNIATDLNNKADVDLSNVTDTAKILMSGMGMPSTKAITLAIGASGSKVEMPAKGWLYAQGRSGAGDQYMAINVSGNSVYHMDERQVPYAGGLSTVFTPVNNGDVITYYYNISDFQALVFIYAQGSESEAA